MLLNTEISIAFKNFYGQYDLKNFSLFEIDKFNKNLTTFHIKIVNNGIVIKLKCPLCENYHYYRYNISEFIKRDLIAGGCEVLGLPLFYLGRHGKVIQRIDRYNDVNKNYSAVLY